MSDISTSRVQQSVSFDVAKKNGKIESSSSTTSRVGSTSVKAIADSTATRAKSSNSFNPSKVSIESSNSEKQSVTVSPKISRFKAIKQKVVAFGKSIIAGVKAHPYKTSAVIVASAAAILVGASLKGRNYPALNPSNAKDQSSDSSLPLNNGDKKLIKAVDISSALPRKVASGVSAFTGESLNPISEFASLALEVVSSACEGTGEALSNLSKIEKGVLAAICLASLARKVAVEALAIALRLRVGVAV